VPESTQTNNLSSDLWQKISEHARDTGHAMRNSVDNFYSFLLSEPLYNLSIGIRRKKK